MKNTRCCPKCHSENIVRVPDNPSRYISGNNIYTTTVTIHLFMYALVKSGQFSYVRAGRVIRVSKLSFDKWLNQI